MEHTQSFLFFNENIREKNVLTLERNCVSLCDVMHVFTVCTFFIFAHEKFRVCARVCHIEVKKFRSNNNNSKKFFVALF